MRILHKAGKYAARRERKGLWRGIATAIATVVVFCTTYALILPAVTMETQSFSCGLEAHTHTQECYQRTCGMQEYFSHSHTEECYEDGTLVCTLTERTCHHHGPDCYSQAEPTCGLTEAAAHAHTEQCYTLQSVVVCGQEASEGHCHTEGCYTVEAIPCALAETPGHSHTDGCYLDGVLTCGLEETTGHTHSSECSQTRQVLTCTLTETPGHTHGEDCFQEQSVLSCGLEESQGHTHGAECYPGDFQPELICGQEDIPEHRHSEACDVCICEKQEHTHSEACVDSHEAFLENQEEINPGTEPAGTVVPENGLNDPDVPENGLDDSDVPDVAWDDPDAAEEAGYLLVCEVEEEGHVHDEECYFPIDALEQLPQNSNYASGARDGENSNVVTLPGKYIEITAREVVYDPGTKSFSTKVNIHFNIPGVPGEKTVSTEKTYVYHYPAGIEIPQTLLDKPDILVNGNTNMGTYTFRKLSDGSYTVELKFNDTYVNGLALGDNVDGNVSFSGEFAESRLQENRFVLDDGQTVVPILGEIKYPSHDNFFHNIDVTKSGNVSVSGDMLNYTVLVSTTKGTPGSIDFNDVLAIPEGLSLGSELASIKVEKGSRNYYSTWASDVTDWTEVPDVTPSYNDGKLSMTLGKLNAEQTKDANGWDYIHGELYRITYSIPITEQTVSSVHPNNRVTVSSTNGDTVEKSADAKVDIYKDMNHTLEKQGALSTDKPGFIQWTISVNQNGQDLAGAKLTDTMLGLVEDAKNITVTSSGSEEAVAAAKPVKDENGVITGFTFEPTDNGANRNTYIITYETPVTENWDTTQVKNNAILDPDPETPNDEKKVEATVTVNGVQLSKDGSHNPVTNALEWTITVNAGKLNIAGATLTDDMFASLNGSDFTITSSGGITTGHQFVYDENGTTITGIRFDAIADGKNTQSYIIKYTTSPENTTATSVTNTATLTPASEEIGKPIVREKTINLEEPSLSKTGYYDQNAQRIYWTVTVNANERDIAGAVLQDSMMNRLEALEVKDKNGSVISEDAGHYTVSRDDQGKITSIKFQAIGDTGHNLNQYTVTYSTEEPILWDERTVENDASLNGKSLEQPAKVTVPGSGYMQKNVESATITEDGNLIITWTVYMSVPNGGLPAGSVVIDDVTKDQQGNIYTNHWITEEQANALRNGEMVWKDWNNHTQMVPFGENQITFTGETAPYSGFSISFPDGLRPPQDNLNRLYITYSTTASLENAEIGQNKFYNAVTAGGKEARADYTYYQPGIQKTDGSGSTQETTVTNEGSLTWKVKAWAGMNNHTLTLEDTLPNGLSLSGLRLTGWNNLNVQLTVGEDGTISGTDESNQYVFDGSSYRNNTITLTLQPMDSSKTISAGAEFTLTIDCTVDATVDKTQQVTFKNTASLTVDDGSPMSSSQTQKWTYQKAEVDIVSKSGQWYNNSRMLVYTVLLNPEGADLVEGSDTLSLTDVLKYSSIGYSWHQTTGELKNVNVTISLEQSSVRLTDTSTGDVITWAWTYSSASNPNNSQEILNTITGTVPDGKPLKLEYTYVVSSDVEEDYKFNLDVRNNAQLYNHSSGDTSLSGNREWSNAVSSGDVNSKPSLTITKVDANNNALVIPGTEFSIYTYDMTTGDRLPDPKKVFTDSDGRITIRQEEGENGQNVYQTNVLYVAVETAAADGYQLPSSPPEFYFYFSGTEATTGKSPTEIAPGAVDLSKNKSVQLVKNTLIPVASVEVQKVWKDKDGNVMSNPGGSVNVSLYRKTTQSAASGGGEVTVTFNVTKQEYNSILACGTPNSVTCRSGTTFSFTINTWGTPSISVNGTALEPGEPTTGSYGGDNKDYPYQFTATENTVVTGYAENNNDNSLTYTYVQPPVVTDPEEPTTPEGTLVQTVTLNNANGWKYTFTNLPLTGEEAGNTVNYYYYVIEEPVDNYTTTYENNGGVQSGTIKVYNQALANPSYSLPATGGVGWEGYTVTGLLVSIGAVLGLMKKRKKGDC